MIVRFVSEIWDVWRRLWTFATGLLFPERCAGCGMIGVSLCEACMGRLEEVFMKGEIVVDGFRVFFAAGHSEILRKVLHRFKYVSDEMLVEALGELLVRRARCALEKMNVKEVGRECVFVPVPLHRRRARERGFNQSAMLAKVMARDVGGSVEELLERSRATDVQARLPRAERIENVKEAFQMRDHVVKSAVEIPVTVFVVDDVITTGSTFIECAKVLKSAGVRNVYGIMLAHGL